MKEKMNLHFPELPSFTTARLRLRKLRADDREEIFQLRSDPQVNAFIDRENYKAIEEADGFIQTIETGYNKGGLFYWAISEMNNPALLGTICIWNINESKNHAELGYELRPSYQGKGYMQEAIGAVTKFAFDKMQIQTLLALVKPGNLASIHVILKHRFNVDNEQRFLSADESQDHIVYFLQNEITPNGGQLRTGK